jgi:hypothetical protein
MYDEVNNDGPDVPGVCIMCGVRDEDVVICFDPHCWIEIHPGCGKRCEACRQAICDAHVIYIGEEPHCSMCAPEVMAILFMDDVMDCIVASIVDRIMEEQESERRVA